MQTPVGYETPYYSSSRNKLPILNSEDIYRRTRQYEGHVEYFSNERDVVARLLQSIQVNQLSRHFMAAQDVRIMVQGVLEALKQVCYRSHMA